jgi:hypothetical protein
MRQLAEFGSDHGPTYLAEFKDLDDELRFLRRTITSYRMRPQIRDLATSIISNSGVLQRDKKGQALAIAEWTAANIYYIHELPERFQLPDETLRSKHGDCDDYTTLIGSLIEAIGIPSIMVAMRIGMKWSHIFPAARLPTGLLPLDATNRFGLNVNPIAQSIAAGKAVSLKLA